jgi:serine/threonine protein kinase
VQDSLRQIEKTLFDAALSLPDPAEREAFLAYSCNGRPDMRAQIEELLAVHSDAERFFDINVLRAVSGDASEDARSRSILVDKAAPEPELDDVDQADSRIGRYRLLRCLGDGGCGVVFAAEQQEPVRREVALKIIRLGMDTELVIARFDVERRALALMNHPNIAHVLDAGATKSGRPYFVMELVPGTKITRYCDDHHLGVRERLELFIQVCMAIQHAHQKGILHLDIKPSNVLITIKDGAPSPKVIDFGIGKAIEGPLAEGSALVSSDHFIGTPAYMSPEQAASTDEDIDTRSDIYSLGALLYEMLTGRPPFDTRQLAELDVEGLRQVLRKREPPLPSARLLSLDTQELEAVAKQRHCKPAALIRTLRSDLDWIVRQAMAKDRQLRYPTASGLAADVRRYLQHLPVIARPPTPLYALGKLVRRNRLAFVSAAAVTLTLVAGLSASTWLFFREREARRQSEQLRAEAEDRAKLSRAVFLTRDGDFQGADALLNEIKTPLSNPSVDGVEAYRTMGRALAEQGRWREAANHYAIVVQIDQLDRWKLVAQDDQLYATLLIQSGDLPGFDKFRQEAAAHFVHFATIGPQPTVLKAFLLTPVDKKLIAQFQPLEDATETWFATLDPKTQPGLGWAVIAGSLWRYRTADYQGALALARVGYVPRDTTGVCNSIVRLIMAMALAKIGHIDDARIQLVAARNTIANRPSPATAPRSSLWYDWAFAQILLREADALIGQRVP